MTCTRSGCKNVQCYVCSKSCDYSHFDDRSRGGKKGNCPLFDDVEQRHEDEVKAAEELARKQVVSENPNVDEDLLKVNFSEEVRRDEERRRARRPGPRPVAHHHAVVQDALRRPQQHDAGGLLSRFPLRFILVCVQSR